MDARFKGPCLSDSQVVRPIQNNKLIDKSMETLTFSGVSSEQIKDESPTTSS